MEIFNNKLDFHNIASGHQAIKEILPDKILRKCGKEILEMTMSPAGLGKLQNAKSKYNLD